MERQSKDWTDSTAAAQASPSSQRTTPRNGVLEQHALRRVLSYVEENLDAPVTLEALAATARLSRYHFSRLFKRSVGLTPHQYVIRRRLRRARDFLLNSDLSLADVALACGFDSQAHMTATFTATFRVAPGRFRRDARKRRAVAIRIDEGVAWTSANGDSGWREYDVTY